MYEMSQTGDDSIFADRAAVCSGVTVPARLAEVNLINKSRLSL